MVRMLRLATIHVAAALMLAACTSPPGIDVSERPQPTRIDHVSRKVQLALRDPIPTSDVVALRRAVTAFGPAEAVHVSVAVPSATSPATRAALRRHLVLAGVPPTNIVFAPSSGGFGEVTLHRYVMTPPECANFSVDLNRTPQENSNARGGCSNERNLTLMVEDPRDLLRGRSIGPADAEHAANGVERYRNDEVKELLKPERLTTQ